MSTSAALSPPMSSSPMSLDLHAKTDEELDLLPYGVIALDREGVVVRYNRVEARLARLDRALVLGKSFFRTIAPCAATPEFEGRFKTFVADASGPSRVRFPYVFNFRFGSQEVDVDLVRCASPDYVYVCVGRRGFQQQPVRNVPGGALDGVALSQLAPDEGQKGVVRDPHERRNVVLDVSFFDALLATSASGSTRSLEEIGIAYGRRLAIDLEAEAGESFGKGLRELPIVTLIEMIAQLFRRQGWGALVADLRPARSGAIAFTIERSALAEAPGSTGAKRCALVAGILRALLSCVAATSMTVRETRCSAEGAPHCTFVATGAKREVALNEAIAASGGNVTDVLRALGAQA